MNLQKEKITFVALRLFELLFHAAIPAVALYGFAKNNQMPDLVVVLSLFFVLVIWYILFVLFHQFQYPSRLQPAITFTALTIIQLCIVVATSSITFFAYIYYIQSLVVMAVLLVLGALYIASSEKKIKNQSWLSVALFIFAAGTLWYLSELVSPTIEYIFSVPRIGAALFLIIMLLQIAKEIVATARYMKMKDHQKIVHPLPQVLVVATLCIGILVSAIVVVL